MICMFIAVCFGACVCVVSIYHVVLHSLRVNDNNKAVHVCVNVCSLRSSQTVVLPWSGSYSKTLAYTNNFIYVMLKGVVCRSDN